MLWWIVVGLIAGWATGKIMKGSGYGALLDIVLGIVGAIVGGRIAMALGISPAGGMLYTILIAILGAVVIVALVRLITGRRALT
ncbi:MAG TPA: GlsB/YeaQ/YmgE family stress response membrane protein [Acidobacteriaceae bacterium]